MRFFIIVIFGSLILGFTSCHKKKKVNITLDSLLQLSAPQVVRTFGKKAIMTGGNDFFILFPASQQEIRVGWDPGTDVITSLRVDVSTKGLKQNIDTLPDNWRTNSGLYLGATLEEVQKLNGQPFMLTKSDNGIWISDWAQGALSFEKAEVVFSIISSLEPNMPNQISSDVIINNKWNLQISSITLRKQIEVTNSEYLESEPDELTEEEILAARQEFKNAIIDLQRVSLPYDFLNIMESEGNEVKCYGFPDDSFCNLNPQEDMNSLYSMLADTTEFYAVFWSGKRFAYYADIPKLFLTTFDKNWKPISTADLHIWLASWKFEQGDCNEVGDPHYSAVLNSDLSFLLTYSSEFGCAGDQDTSTSKATIAGQINADGTISITRDGFD